MKYESGTIAGITTLVYFFTTMILLWYGKIQDIDIIHGAILLAYVLAVIEISIMIKKVKTDAKNKHLAK